VPDVLPAKPGFATFLLTIIVITIIVTG